MTGPERIWTASTSGRCHVGFGTPSENYQIEYVRRDPAVLAALPEVQALIAAACEVAAAMIEDNVRHAKELGREIWPIPDLRTVTSHDATAALARIVREAEARGRAMGLREAAGIAEGAWGEGPTGHYDNGGTMDGWNLACSHVASAILARADQIEKDAAK